MTSFLYQSQPICYLVGLENPSLTLGMIADQVPSCTLVVALAGLLFALDVCPLEGCCPSLAPPGPWQSWEKCPFLWQLKHLMSFLDELLFFPLLWDSDD